MSSYTNRDIRAADMLAIILIGFGVVLLFFGAMPLVFSGSGKGGGSNHAVWLTAGFFVVLGTAPNLKIRQLVRNKGHEPEDYPGVPD